MERIGMGRFVDEFTTRLGKRWAWFVGFGVLFIILGVLALGNQLFATIASVYFLAFILLSGGIIQIIEAFHMRVVNRALYFGIAGLLYAIAGVIIYFQPLVTSVVLTMLLAAVFIAAGIVKIWDGIKFRKMMGSSWVIFSGVLTLVLGLFVIKSWPENSLFVIGILVGVDILFQGWVCFSLGLSLREYHQAQKNQPAPQNQPQPPHA